MKAISGLTLGTAPWSLDAVPSSSQDSYACSAHIQLAYETATGPHLQRDDVSMYRPGSRAASSRISKGKSCT